MTFCTQVMARVYPAIFSMLNWVQRFMRTQPAKNATVEVRAGEGAEGANTVPMCVRQVSHTASVLPYVGYCAQ